MDKAKEAIIDEAIKEYKNGNIKSSGDVENFLDDLIGPILQKLLEAELDSHLDYAKHEKKNEKSKDNNRNGHCKEKMVKTKYGESKIKTPRDRKGTFEPILVPKKSNVFSGLEDACVSLYAKGMSMRDIENIINQLYSVKITKDQVSHFVSKVSEEVKVWQNRKLKKKYSFVYADCLYYSIKRDTISEKNAVYLLIGISVDGYKEVLGMWCDKTESATFWNEIFRDIKSRGVEDILYVCSDGIAGFKSSLSATYPKAQAQRCIVHLCRNLMQNTPKKIAKETMRLFKNIYQSSTADLAEENLNKFVDGLSSYPKIVEQVKGYMEYIYPLMELPIEIRKVIYTTNLIESVNSTLRRVTNNKGAFNNETSLFQILYLRINDLQQKWLKPIPNHKKILKQLLLLHNDRILKYYKIDDFDL